MGDDLDVDALLEAPYRKEEKKEANSRDGNGHRDEKERRSRSKSPHRRKDSRRSDERDRRRSRSRERSRRRSRSRDRDRGGRDRRRSRSRDKYRRRSTSRERRNRRSRSRERGDSRKGRGRYGSPKPRSKSRSPELPLTPEERDARTIFIMQLSQRVRARDVEEFFSSVGKIRDVKLIICNKTRRFKGIAYVEFKEMESVALAIGLNGQKLLGVPVVVQPSQAEKNRVGNYNEIIRPKDKGPMRLYVGSLHFNITEDMLKGIFEPFGKIQSIQLVKDIETTRSKGYGFVTYCEGEDAKKALEQLNGFELAGRPMKVGHVTERTDAPIGNPGLDSDELDRAGIDLGATGRLALMAKLAEGTGMKLPDAANQALSSVVNVPPPGPPSQPPPPAPPADQPNSILLQKQAQLANMNPPVGTQCFMLSNMFVPKDETNPDWENEVREDVIEECNRCGGVLHIVVDKESPSGNVYVKCPSIEASISAVNALHGRYFGGKVITAAYVPLVNYHNLFPEAEKAETRL